MHIQNTITTFFREKQRSEYKDMQVLITAKKIFKLFGNKE